MHSESTGEDRDLRAAAEIFLRGPVPVGARARGVEIGGEAITRVADHLATSDAMAVADIREALRWHRSVGTTASREAVIEAVTAAVAHPNRHTIDRSRSV